MISAKGVGDMSRVGAGLARGGVSLCPLSSFIACSFRLGVSP